MHEANYECYGYRRTWKQLLREGERVPRCRVQRLMRDHGIRGAKGRGKPWRTTNADPEAERRPDLGAGVAGESAIRRASSTRADHRSRVADASAARARHRRVRRLVQPPAAARVPRRHRPGRVRTPLRPLRAPDRARFRVSDRPRTCRRGPQINLQRVRQLPSRPASAETGPTGTRCRPRRARRRQTRPLRTAPGRRRQRSRLWK